MSSLSLPSSVAIDSVHFTNPKRSEEFLLLNPSRRKVGLWLGVSLYYSFHNVANSLSVSLSTKDPTMLPLILLHLF